MIKDERVPITVLQETIDISPWVSYRPPPPPPGQSENKLFASWTSPDIKSGYHLKMLGCATCKMFICYRAHLFFKFRFYQHDQQNIHHSKNHEHYIVYQNTH